MRNYVIIILVALGTYLTRFLPIKFGKKFRELKDIDEFLRHSSTALISALFITTLISFPIESKEMIKGILALLCVFVVYRIWKNLGISVLVGVISHFLLSLMVK